MSSQSSDAPKSGTEAPGSGKKPDLDPEVERQLREAAETEDTLVTDMRDKCRSEFNKRSSLLTDQFNVSFNSQMSNMGDRYTSQLHENVTIKQTDVLRTNKIIRDVSRDLGSDWKAVFLRLMKDHDEGKVRVEMARIERQKPFMQAFKALNTWKDLLGDKFDIRMLSEALTSVDRRDLAEKVLDTLDSNELDSLYSLEGVGKGITGGAAPRQPPSRTEDASNSSSDATTSDVKPKQTKPAAVPTEDPVGDRILLKIAKGVDSEWLPLAQSLNLSEEDIQETKESGGSTYQGAFKALYTWRDTQIESGQLTEDMVNQLKEALTKVGKPELVSAIPC